MKTIAFLLPFLFSLNLVHAQDQETVFEYSGLKLTGIWGGPVFGLTHLGDNNVFVRGGFGGLEFNKNLFVGYGGYWLDKRITIPEFPNQRLDFSYKGLILSYAYRPTKVVHPKLSFLIGGGSIDVEDESEDKVLIFQPTGGLEINVFKWWHLDFLGGYRFVMNTDLPELTDETMSSFFAEIKLRFGISWGWK